VVPERGFEPLSPKAADFESAVYTIPPLWLVRWNDSDLLLKRKYNRSIYYMEL
jgi:hypothetical protein